MALIDTRDLFFAPDMRSRLQSAIDEGDQKIGFLFGAGVSIGAVPGTEQMIERFLSASTRDSRGVRPRAVEDRDPGDRYQSAASSLVARSGQQGLFRAVVDATLEASDFSARFASTDKKGLVPDDLAMLENSLEWRITEAHRRFAEVYSKIPPEKRGPIITTNFDPLIEIALRQESIDAEPVSLVGDRAPIESIGRSPLAASVMHLHGYWRSRATLHTRTTLDRQRDEIRDYLKRELDGIVLFVLGYAGWEDEFMRALDSVFASGALFDSEICWGVFSSDQSSILTNSRLASLIGCPGFNIYFDCNASKVLDYVPLEEVGVSVLRVDVESPPGYSVVGGWRGGEIPAGDREFADGGQPAWPDAIPGVWPQLSSTVELIEAGRQMFSRRSGYAGCVGMGPVGEGKSLALMQAAVVMAAEFPDTIFLWRHVGAPPLTPEWLNGAMEAYGSICLCLDDSDLISGEIAACASVWNRTDSQVKFLLSCHDRAWWNGPLGKRYHQRFADVLFHGIDASDAHNVAVAWFENGALPPAFESDEGRDQVVERVRARLELSAMGVEGSSNSTLMGAILATRFSRGLDERVYNFMKRLEGEKFRTSTGINLADLFAAVCLVQSVNDPSGLRGLGMTRDLLNEMSGDASGFGSDRIVRILGKEALVSFAGERVYSRHSAIAERVVAYHRDQGRLLIVCRELGRAAGRLRVGNSTANRPSWFAVAEVSKGIHIVREAVAICVGVRDSAPNLLAPNIDYMKALRMQGDDRAMEIGVAVCQNMSRFEDVEENIRVFLNEMARCALRSHVPSSALGLAAIGAGGRFKFVLDPTQKEYLLKTWIDAGERVGDQTGDRLSTIVGAAARLALVVVQPKSIGNFGGRKALEDRAGHWSTVSPDKCSEELSKALNGFARAAARDFGLERFYLGALDLSVLTKA
ncbi:SIR2 family protein [Tsukamurella tyrosinosolvens]|uniref:P-loop NTPase n=1 Tax=Tsukamurella tyrosinosolvens TaxID=57704 RepID=UPI000DF71BAA|nr:SIR2 family protein [Tsukamurella tyrosinosolvens]RDB45488.1 hypothetical protein DVB87_23540 [Tsukamurella tyrosinosolvens]